MIEYFIGSDNPSLACFWRDWTGRLVDFSSNYTFEVKVGSTAPSVTPAATFTKSTGITGAAGDLTAVPQVPNVTVAWATSGELNTLTAGLWMVQIRATTISDSRSRYLQVIILMKSVLT